MFEGEVIELLAGGGKCSASVRVFLVFDTISKLFFFIYPVTKIAGNDRRCKYLIDGFVEDLSKSDLQMLAKLEIDNPIELGKVGYRFRKQFNDGWYDGIVVKVLKRGGKIHSRRLSSS